MKNWLLLLTLVGLVFSYPALAQQNDTLILNSGKFYGVKASANGNIFLIQSDSTQVRVSPADFNIKDLKLKVENNILTVEAKGMSNQNKIYIYAPDFNLLDVSGATNAKSEGQIKGKIMVVKSSGASDVDLELDLENMEINASGSSSVLLDGKVDTIRMKISGASDVKGFTVKNIYTEVDASGASDIQINPDSMLKAEVTGASSLKYQKEPARKEIKASGVTEATRVKTVWVEADENEFKIKEGEDTVTININGSEIIVIEKDGETKVLKRKVESKKKEPKFRGNWAGLELGINGYLNKDFGLDVPSEYSFMELDYPVSLNFNINFFQQSLPIFGHKFGMVTGMGIQWYNYRFNNSATILTTDSGSLGGYIDQTAGRSYSKSKLTAMYLVVPLLLEFQTNRHHKTNSFHIAAGAIGGVRLSSHTKQVYSFDGSGKNKPKSWGDFYLQPFRLDATVRVGWGPLNLYGNYSLIPMFRNNKGPELYPFTFGVILPFT